MVFSERGNHLCSGGSQLSNLWGSDDCNHFGSHALKAKHILFCMVLASMVITVDLYFVSGASTRLMQLQASSLGRPSGWEVPQPSISSVLLKSVMKSFHVTNLRASCNFAAMFEKKWSLLSPTSVDASFSPTISNGVVYVGSFR